MRVFMTGASGFIGERLLKVLRERRYAVHALCRQPLNLLNGEVTFFPGDILDPASVERAMRGCEGVLHLAGYAKNWARRPEEYYEVNVGGTENVLEAALKNGVQRVVYTSTAMTIGPSNGHLLTENCPRRTRILTHYESSKMKAENLVQRFVDRGLNAVIVNPTRVFGPGLLSEGNSLTRMITYYLHGKWRVIPGNGEALGNYAFVEDVALGHLYAMERGTSGQRYILGGENTSYNTFFDTVTNVSHRRHKLVHLPDFLAITASHFEERRARLFHGYPSITPGWMETFLLDSAYSCSKAVYDLGYHITPLSEALQRTVQWILGTKDKI